jgi:hypothetical protein
VIFVVNVLWLFEFNGTFENKNNISVISSLLMLLLKRSMCRKIITPSQ